MLKARAKLRRTRDRWIDQTLVNVERARAALVAGEADVLVLGDSSCLAFAHTDTDRASIPELMARRTGAKVVTVAAGGYSAPIYSAILDLLAGLPQRPKAVVVTACIRTGTATHVRRHPIHGHARSLEALGRIRKVSPDHKIRAFGRGGHTWTDEELAAFRALPVTTRWHGEQLIGDHLARVENRGMPPWPIEVERDRFDYFHGEVLSPDNTELPAYDVLGRRLVEYGVPSATFWVQPSVEHGEGLYPGEFADHVAANLAVLESVLDLPGRGLGELIKPVLDIPDFQDARNGTEHYSFSGRAKIADVLVERLGDHLG
jgi:hypothetical protein